MIAAFYKKTPSTLYHLVATIPLGAMVAALAYNPWRFVVSKPLRFLGKHSFSMYIVHFFVNDRLCRAWSRFGLVFPSWFEFVLYYACVVAGTALLSTLTFRWIEQRGIALTRPLIAWLEARFLQKPPSPANP